MTNSNCITLYSHYQSFCSIYKYECSACWQVWVWAVQNRLQYVQNVEIQCGCKVICNTWSWIKKYLRKTNQNASSQWFTIFSTSYRWYYNNQRYNYKDGVKKRALIYKWTVYYMFYWCLHDDRRGRVDRLWCLHLSHITSGRAACAHANTICEKWPKCQFALAGIYLRNVKGNVQKDTHTFWVYGCTWSHTHTWTDTQACAWESNEIINCR